MCLFPVHLFQYPAIVGTEEIFTRHISSKIKYRLIIYTQIFSRGTMSSTQTGRAEVHRDKIPLLLLLVLISIYKEDNKCWAFFSIVSTLWWFLPILYHNENTWSVICHLKLWCKMVIHNDIFHKEETDSVWQKTMPAVNPDAHTTSPWAFKMTIIGRNGH